MAARTASAVESPFPVITSKEHLPVKSQPPTTRPENGALPEISSNQRKDISVPLQYLANDPVYNDVKLIQVTPPFPRDRRTNIRLSPGPGEILNDVRGREDQFTLDNNGFCYVNAPTQFTNWSSQPAIAKEFLPEMEALLKREIEGCDEVIFYDARIRQESDQGVRVQGVSYNPYARQVHVDNTEQSVIEKIRNITDMKSEYHLSGRARIINIWRPIKHPVYDCGLAIADGGKLKEGDVLECDRLRQDTGQYWDTMGVIRYRPGFDWYYMSYQDEQNVLLFKNYDSAKDVSARLCLHTAFDMPPEDIPPNAPTRESIEIRALVFTHPKGGRKVSWTSQPHPLALTLEQNNLKLIDDEHSITDRFRTDIDEGKEMKDAMLLLRRAEIHRLESVREAVSAERDDLKLELHQSKLQFEQAQQQIDIQTAHAEALQARIDALEQERLQSNGNVHNRIHNLSKDLTDSRIYQHARAKDEDDGLSYYMQANGAQDAQSAEHALLLETIERQQDEIDKWKAEAMGRGNEAVSRSWQASVDEAVRSEREKDYFVIQSLKEEIERLKAG